MMPRDRGQRIAPDPASFPFDISERRFQEGPMIRTQLTRAVFLWPAVFVIRVGIAILTLAESPVGRLTIRPLFRVFCRFVLYARVSLLFRRNAQYVYPTHEVARILQDQNIIAIIPCACRAGSFACQHPLHKPHESNTCLSFGLAALWLIGSGLGKRIDEQEAQRLFSRAADSGLVHHVIFSMGMPLEICNCCAETCAAIKAYQSGIPEAVRPSGYVAIRGPACNACSGRRGRLCVQICPYEKEPATSQCLGCGLCARRCPQQAITMVPHAVPIREAVMV